MNASDLKLQHEYHHPDSHFFDRKTMKFFGDTMRNYGVRAVIARTLYDREGKYRPEGVEVPAWELYRKHEVKHGLRSSHYFTRDNFAELMGVQE